MRAIALPLLVIGGAVVVLAIFGEILGWREGRGLRWRQAQLFVLGVALMGLGVAAWPTLRQRFATWHRSQAKIGALAVLLFSVWVGLLTGVFEIIHGIVRSLLQDTLDHPVDLLCLKPLCYAVYSAILAAPLALLNAIRPGTVRLAEVVFWLVLVMAWAQFLVHRRLDSGAVLALSAGIAWTAARSSPVGSGAVWRVCRRTLPWIVGLMVVSLGLVLLMPWWRARAHRPPAGVTAPAAAPNVLFIVLDTIRADHLRCYGYERETMPTIDRLAAAGTQFDAMIASSPWTLPSHSTMFTGKYRHEISSGWTRPLDTSYPVLAERLIAMGYSTAGFVGNLGYCSRRHGIDRGFGHYEDFHWTFGTLLLNTSLGNFVAFLFKGPGFVEQMRNDAPTVANGFLDWLDDQPQDGQPFFAFLNFFDAHAVYDPPPDLENMFLPRSDVLKQHTSDATVWSEEQLAGIVAAHDACMFAIDREITRIVDNLRDRGALERTLIVITGDHGEQFGENGLMDHANSLYRPLLHVPMIFHWPGELPARRIPDWVSMRDIPATVLDLVDAPAALSLPGNSLRHHWQPELTAPAEPSPLLSQVAAGIRRPKWEPVSRGGMQSIAVGSLHFIQCDDGSEELYDMAADPREENNLIDDPAYADRRDAMRKELAERLRDRLR